MFRSSGLGFQIWPLAAGRLSMEEPEPENVVDPSNLRITTVPRKDGTYDVIATWEKAPGTVAGYVLYTTNDGKEFTRHSAAGPDEHSVRFTAVPGGTTFGIRVASSGMSGRESAGIAHVVMLPASGIGLLIITGTAGAIAGMRTRRKKARV